MVEWWLLTPEIRGSNPVIDNFNQLSSVLKSSRKWQKIMHSILTNDYVLQYDLSFINFLALPFVSSPDHRCPNISIFSTAGCRNLRFRCNGLDLRCCRHLCSCASSRPRGLCRRSWTNPSSCCRPPRSG